MQRPRGPAGDGAGRGAAPGERPGPGHGHGRALEEPEEPAALRRERRRLLLRLLRAAGPRPLLGLLLRDRRLRRGVAGERREAPGAGPAALLGRPGEEPEGGGDGALRALRARLGGEAEPGLPPPPPLPPAGHGAGAAAGRLLAGSRARSAHGCCGHRAADAPRAAERGASPRRVLSASKGRNKLPWDGRRAAGEEGGSGGAMPSAKGVQQVRTAGPRAAPR